MRPKKSNKKEVKVKESKSIVLRNDSKVKQKSIQSSERLCNRCKVHGITVSFKGHKCPNIECLCVKCMDYMEKNRRKNEQYKQRQLQKKTIKDNKPKDSTSFVNSLKNKSKKILNKKDKSGNTERTPTVIKAKRKRKAGINDGVGDTGPTTNHLIMDRQESRSGTNCGPPQLQRQAIDESIDEVIGNSSSTDVDINNCNVVENQPAPEKSSAALCAQYLKSCEGLSRKLAKYQLSDCELIASLKYFIVRQSLGDIERAVNDIIFAQKEIQLGASYIIQNPGNDPDNNGTQTTTTSIRQTAQPSVSNTAIPAILSSTMYPNFRPNDGPTYSPAFTPIRNN